MSKVANFEEEIDNLLTRLVKNPNSEEDINILKGLKHIDYAFIQEWWSSRCTLNISPSVSEIINFTIYYEHVHNSKLQHYFIELGLEECNTTILDYYIDDWDILLYENPEQLDNYIETIELIYHCSNVNSQNDLTFLQLVNKYNPSIMFYISLIKHVDIKESISIKVNNEIKTVPFYLYLFRSLVIRQYLIRENKELIYNTLLNTVKKLSKDELSTRYQDNIGKNHELVYIDAYYYLARMKYGIAYEIFKYLIENNKVILDSYYIISNEKIDLAYLNLKCNLKDYDEKFMKLMFTHSPVYQDYRQMSKKEFIIYLKNRLPKDPENMTFKLSLDVVYLDKFYDLE